MKSDDLELKADDAAKSSGEPPRDSTTDTVPLASIPRSSSRSNDELTSSLNPYSSLIAQPTALASSTLNEASNVSHEVSLAETAGDLTADTNSTRQRHSSSIGNQPSRGRAPRTNSIKQFTEKALHGVQRFSTDILRSIENAHELVDLKNSNFSSATQSAAAQLYAANTQTAAPGTTRRHPHHHHHHSTRTRSVVDDVLEENEPSGTHTPLHDSTTSRGDRVSVIGGGGGHRSNRCSDCLKEDVENEEREALTDVVEGRDENSDEHQKPVVELLDEIRSVGRSSRLNNTNVTAPGSVASLNKHGVTMILDEDESCNNPNPVKFRAGSLFRGIFLIFVDQVKNLK
jgi:hypothetical protein